MNNIMAYRHHERHHSDRKISTESRKVEFDTTENYRQLGFAIGLQAAKDFFEETEKGQERILKDLRSPRMRLFTDDLSVILAEKLETRPEEVKKHLEETRKTEMRRNLHDNV